VRTLLVPDLERLAADGVENRQETGLKRVLEHRCPRGWSRGLRSLRTAGHVKSTQRRSVSHQQQLGGVGAVSSGFSGRLCYAERDCCRVGPMD
jgi:hypothetical protein